MEPSSRAAAERIGAVFFVTGLPCVRGHLGPRYTSSARCVECARKAAAEQSARPRKPTRKPVPSQPVKQPQDRPVRWWPDGFVAIDERR